MCMLTHPITPVAPSFPLFPARPPACPPIQVCVGGRDGIFMVMEYVEHDLKYVMELQKAKKVTEAG